MSYKSSWLMVCFAVTLSGCGSVSAPQRNDFGDEEEMVPPDKVTVIAKPYTARRLDEEKSFTHRYTGVKLYFPPGWEVGHPDMGGYLADIHLYNREVGLSAMVFWGRTHTRAKTDSAMLAKDVRELRDLYGKQMSDPECVKVGDKIGYRVAIGAPVFDDDKKYQNHYLFYVDSASDISDEESLARGKYTITIMITGEKKQLELGNDVLFYLKWK